MVGMERAAKAVQDSPEENAKGLFRGRGLNMMRLAAFGMVAQGGNTGAHEGYPEMSTVRNVQVQAKPAVTNIVRGLLYIPIGADLAFQNTKAYIVKFIGDVVGYFAPDYLNEARVAAAQIPHVGEAFALAGLVILADGALRLPVGLYRQHTNQQLINVSV